MPYDSREIANYLLDYAAERSRPVTNMVLLKIVYFAHAQHLYQYNRPLTDDVFEAWERGPVVKTLYDCFKKFGAKPITEKAKRVNFDEGTLEVVPYYFDSETKQYLNRIFDTYLRIPAHQLSEMSHEKGGPWDYVWHQPDGKPHLGMRITDALIRARFLAKTSTHTTQ